MPRPIAPTRKARSLRFALLICFTAPMACGDPQEPEMVTFEDAGLVCISDTVEPGATVSVQIQFDECISACATDIQTSCSVEESWDGWGVYILTNAASYTAPAPDTSCDDLCLELTADCGEITVGDGEIAFVHGEEYTFALSDEYYFFSPGDEGCAQNPEGPRPRQVDFETPAGHFCLGGLIEPGSSGGEPLVPDEPFPVSFAHDDCFSSSCTEDFTATCSIEIDGQNLNADVAGSFGDRAYLDANCTADCDKYGTECGELTLPEGTYTLTYNGESHTIAIPSQADCF